MIFYYITVKTQQNREYYLKYDNLEDDSNDSRFFHFSAVNFSTFPTHITARIMKKRFIKTFTSYKYSEIRINKSELDRK